MSFHHQTLRNLYLSARTARHLSLKQIAYRAGFVIKRRWAALRRKKAPAPDGFQINDLSPFYRGLLALDENDAVKEAVSEAKRTAVEISKGRFSFLNRQIDYPERIDWNDHAVSQLWRYHLHYFDYATDLLVWSAEGGARSPAGFCPH